MRCKLHTSRPRVVTIESKQYTAIAEYCANAALRQYVDGFDELSEK